MTDQNEAPVTDTLAAPEPQQDPTAQPVPEDDQGQPEQPGQDR